VSVVPWVQDELEGLSAQSAVTELELMLQLVHASATQPRVEPAEIELARTRLGAVDPAAAFERAISAALQPGRARQAVAGVPSVDAMLRFHRERFGDAGDFEFVIVGDIAEAQLRPLVERYLASLPGSTRSERSLPKDERRAGVTRVRLSGRAARESAVRLAFHGPAQPSAGARMELEALGLQLQSELQEVLREQRGATYSVSVDCSWSAAGYLLTIHFECAPEQVGSLQQASWQVIRQLGSGPLAESAVDALRARLRASYGRGMTSSEFWAHELEQALRHGTPLSDIAKLPELGASVTGESVAAAARRYLKQDRYLDAVWSPGKEE
jgi:zinc protease